MNTRRSDHNIPGLPTRQSALRLLDAVFRTGAPLDHAVQNACKGLAGPDRALAIAIAQEVLRWTPDLDALIDGATSQTLPEDAKARMVLRMALAQMLRLGTPPHAAIATSLPLVESGPRRLVHGVLGTLFRAQSTLPDSPTLSDMVAMRWHAAWGDEMLDNAATALTEPPDLDLSLKDAAQTADYAAYPSRPGIFAYNAASRWRSLTDLRQAIGGCRIWPPACRCGYWAQARTATCSIYAQRPAARRCSSQRRGGR
jgi:16S rRNA (cytosine967-C5)-methyltransferase